MLPSIWAISAVPVEASRWRNYRRNLLRKECHPRLISGAAGGCHEFSAAVTPALVASHSRQITPLGKLSSNARQLSQAFRADATLKDNHRDCRLDSR